MGTEASSVVGSSTEITTSAGAGSITCTTKKVLDKEQLLMLRLKNTYEETKVMDEEMHGTTCVWNIPFASDMVSV
ncbi:hypothetical protein Fmac_003731 [Flemingia macrophylla]|uniref:Uncharacterized protein n=1 Tax=Flemingia macrophylla TaxID=520843 RepID=A0ABD1N2W8_9FABA